MTGIAEDQDAARELVCEAYLSLRELSPRHELLNYLVERRGDYFFNQSKAKEFDRTFSDEREGKETPLTLKLNHYFLALEKAKVDLRLPA